MQEFEDLYQADQDRAASTLYVEGRHLQTLGETLPIDDSEPTSPRLEFICRLKKTNPQVV